MRVAESRHRKSEIKSLGRGYPDTLQVFRMPASKFWYVGMYLKSKGRFVKKSTGCELLSDAKEFARIGTKIVSLNEGRTGMLVFSHSAHFPKGSRPLNRDRSLVASWSRRCSTTINSNSITTCFPIWDTSKYKVSNEKCG